MRRLAFLLCLVVPSPCRAEPWISIDEPMAPPAWALVQRALLEANADAALQVAGKYADQRGWLSITPNWGGMDGPDDVMERFRHWPLLYILGGPESVLSSYKKIWEGHLEQFTEAREPLVEGAREGMYYRKFCPSFDWEHIGEGMAGWYWYGMARPRDQQYLIRARRFSSFYMNEDPGAPNYDPERKIIRSLFTGSRGPLLGTPTEADWAGPPRPRHDPRPRRPRRTLRFSRQGYLVDLSGDHPLNLMSTNLALTAYMLTHEAKYRRWILEYVDAWKERIRANDGNIPTNIGLDGSIGGQWEGKWYGGVYGWNFRPRYDEFTPDLEGQPYPGSNMFIRGSRIGFGIALLLTGNPEYPAILRRQFDNLYAAGREEGGRFVIPHKHGNEGWYGYTDNVYLEEQIDVYLWTFDPVQRERVSAHPWIRYLNGNHNDYPLQALEQDFAVIGRQMKRLRDDTATPDTRSSTGFPRSVAVTSLLHLMLGANYPGGSGNALHAQVRYFDPELRRAGLPPDVGALVERISRREVTLTLVNTSPVHPRDVVIQTGGYAEHRCISVEQGDKAVQVDDSHFGVRLEPGSGGRLVLSLERYAGAPTLAFPWDR